MLDLIPYPLYWLAWLAIFLLLACARILKAAAGCVVTVTAPISSVTVTARRDRSGRVKGRSLLLEGPFEPSDALRGRIRLVPRDVPTASAIARALEGDA